MPRARDDKARENDDRVSLAGLDPEEALRALLKVDPESEPSENPDERRERQPKSESAT